VGAGVAAIVLAALASRLWLDRRDLGAALNSAREELDALPVGLPVGAIAPGFALPDLDGGTQTLESLRSRGLPVALVFVSPTCGPCHLMLPEIGRWQVALADRLTIALVSQGSPDDNEPLAAEYGIDNMLLQADFEVLTAYRVRGTPSAVVVTPEGAIGSSVVSSNVAIEPLLRLALRRRPTAALGA
jgi:thiol-disulfide isomerase/thioredoxin